MKLEVPYYSQFVDIVDPFWMLRACGALSFISVAEFYGVPRVEVLSFCEEAKQNGGYDMQNGWVHDYIVSEAKKCKLFAYRKEGITELDEIIMSLSKGEPVIVSVEKRVLEQKRFHMIVLTGFEKDEYGLVSHFYYHETESTDRENGKHRKCSKDIFIEYFRGKAIFISKKRQFLLDQS